MVRLVNMSEAEFETFINISMGNQAKSLVESGIWPAEEADERIQKQRDQFLPGGLNTPDHYFFKIVGQEIGTEVGELWYTVVEPDGMRQFFVFDIQINDTYRRRGYGTEAFMLMEDEARKMGISTISLDVVETNRPARIMYEKLGYAGSDERMSKELDES